MNAAKAFWTVRAQLIPSIHNPSEPAKQWTYTSEDKAEDDKLPGGRYQPGAIFRTLQADALAFATDLQLEGWNVVTLEYVWA